jgi:hypothetical protein
MKPTFLSLLMTTANGKIPSAKARFKFDRTQWSVQYGSGDFFGAVGNNAISDAIGIELNLKGNSL